MAQLYGQAYRFILFGKLHYWPIRGHELEVSYLNSNRIASLYKAYIRVYSVNICIMSEI